MVNEELCSVGKKKASEGVDRRGRGLCERAPDRGGEEGCRGRRWRWRRLEELIERG